VRQTDLQTRFLIYPLFVVEGSGIKKEIASMPGVFQMSVDEILKECEALISLGLDKILLFGIPSLKDSIGSDALSEDGIIATSLRAIKAKFPNLLVITDLCFCEYTDHGHCGIIDHVHQTVDNDATLEISAQQALKAARALLLCLSPSASELKAALQRDNAVKDKAVRAGILRIHAEEAVSHELVAVIGLGAVKVRLQFAIL